MSSIRQNFSKEVENLINKQINLELNASYIYLSMFSYFSRHDVALPNMAEYFRKNSEEERGHAEKLIRYQNTRGGTVVLYDVKAPEINNWASALTAFQAALELEKKVNESLLNLHSAASENNDAQFCDFLENHYLEEQVKAIKELGDHITNLKRVGNDLGIYLFDKEFKS